MGTISQGVSYPDFWHIALAHWNWFWVLVVLGYLNPKKPF